MPEILSTPETVIYLAKLINEAEKYLYIVSPYIKSQDVIHYAKEKNPLVSIDYEDICEKIDVTVIFGKDIKQADRIVLDYIEAKVLYCENLHAKIYLSEKSAIVSSMNLYDYSYKNNHEISVFFDRAKYPEQWDKIYEQVKVIKKASVREW